MNVDGSIFALMAFFSSFLLNNFEKIPFYEIIFSLRRKNNSKKYYFFKLFFHLKWENNLKLFFQNGEKIIFSEIIFSLRRGNNLKKYYFLELFFRRSEKIKYRKNNILPTYGLDKKNIWSTWPMVTKSMSMLK